MENAKEVTKAIGERLRGWRRSMEKTQAEMAALLGVNIGVLRKYEIGLNAPGGLILAVACSKGLNISWLLTGQGNMLVTSESGGYAPYNLVLDRLCKSLDTLRELDPPKYALLSRAFIVRSEEACEHAALKIAASHQGGTQRNDSMFDILSAPIDLLPDPSESSPPKPPDKSD